MHINNSFAQSTQVSVLIPWAGRPELLHTLKANLPHLQKMAAEIILVNCTHDSAVLAPITDFDSACPIRRVEAPMTRFNKSLALNLGLYMAKAETVLTLDSDVLLHAETLSIQDIDFKTSFFTVRSMRETSLLPQPFHFLSELGNSELVDVDQIHSLRFTWSDGTTSEVQTARKSLVDGNRAGAGLLLVRKAHLIAIGGYNSSLEHWGWEDNEIQLRLRQVLKLIHVERGSVDHITHGDEVRAMHGLTRADLTFYNLEQSVRKFAEGNFEGSFHADVLAWQANLV